jgi:LAS superfamily LD-carboxypeptidase LdcB
MLVDIDDKGHQLEESAGKAFLEMKAAAVAAGFDVVVNSATRDQEKQKELFCSYIKAMSAWMKAGSKAEDKPKPVAAPGKSEHEFGIACDLNVKDPNFFRWLKTNSTSFGFWFTASREPWHIAHYPDGPPTHLRERHLSNLRSWSG